MHRPDPHVLVAGGGLAGLCTAFELSEIPGLQITLLEASPYFGGKIQADYNPELQRFEEHSIRVMSSTYLSFFDIMQRAGLMDWISPALEYQFCTNKLSQSLSISRWQPLGFKVAKEMCQLFELRPNDLLSLAFRAFQLTLGRPQHRELASQLSFQEALGLDRYHPKSRDFILRWIGMLAGARAHSRALDVLDSFALMFIPRDRAPGLPGPDSGKSFVFNRPSGGYARALAKILEKRGVALHLNTRLEQLKPEGQYFKILCGKPKLDQTEYDAVVLCTPIEVSRALGALPPVEPKSQQQWSVGAQFLLSDLPKTLQPYLHTPFNLCFDTPWDLVFQIQSQASCWPNVEFPTGYAYNLSISASSLHKNGSLYQKPFVQCTPKQVLHEYLFQLGFEQESQREALCARSGLDPFFLKFSSQWRDYLDRPEVEMGPLLPCGHRWINAAPIYLRNDKDPIVEHRCRQPGLVLAGEGVDVPGPWQIPSMEQAALSAKQASHALLQYLGQDSPVQVLTSKPTLNPRLASLLSRWL